MKSLSFLFLLFVMTLRPVKADSSGSEPAAAKFFLKPNQLAEAEKASAKGSASDAYRVGMHYQIAMSDPVNGKKWLTTAAKQGSADAQYVLACILIDLPDKRQEGIAWMRRAAEGGCKKAKDAIKHYEK